MIQIEAAGPELPEIIYIAPDRLVSMADWVLTTCVRSPGGAVGGFITSDLSALEDYITTPGINLDERYRKLQVPVLRSRVPSDLGGVLTVFFCSTIHCVLHRQCDDHCSRLAFAWKLRTRNGLFTSQIGAGRRADGYRATSEARIGGTKSAVL